MFRAAASAVARRSAVVRVSAQRGIPCTSTVHFHATAKCQDEKKSSDAVEPKKGFWEPMYSVPLGIAFAVPAIHYEWYLVNEETQLAACFIAFTMIVYKQFGGSIHEFLEQDGKRILAEHNNKEDEVIQLLKDQLAEMKAQDNIVQDAVDVQELREATYEKLNAAGKVKPLHDFKQQMEKILSVLSHEEANMLEKAKHELMDEATKSVTDSFLTKKDLQKKSLDIAISQLEGKASKKEDPVQAAYMQFFKDKAKEASQVDEKAEIAETRSAIVAKLNAIAMNEGFFFKLDDDGKPKMVV